MLGAIAIAAVAWFAVGFRDETLLEHAEDVAIARTPSHAQLDTALADADDAELLNPDWAESEGLRATLNIRAQRNREAYDALRRIVRREPENLQAWALLSLISRQLDPPLAERAARRVRELDPLNVRRP